MNSRMERGRKLRALLARARARARAWKYAYLIRRSGLFDAEYYRSQRPNDAGARRWPILHYLRVGTAAGLDPCRFFDTSYYLEQNADVAASGKNPLVHFLRHGARERRAPSPRLEIIDQFALARFARGRAPNPLERYRTHPPEAASARRPALDVPRSVRGDLPERSFELAPCEGRILVIDQRVPAPQRDSASVRMLAIVSLLRELGHEVTFVSDATERKGSDDRRLRHLGVEVIHGFPAAMRHLNARGGAYRAALLSSPRVAERYLMAARAYAVNASVIYDTVDLHWLRLERGAALSGDPLGLAEAARYRRIESLASSCADLTLAVTAEDRAALLRDVPGANVELLPNIHAPEGSSVPWNARRDLMFVGSFAHAPNADGVEWFVERILPLVRRRLPGVVLQVAGGDVPARVRRLDSAEVHILGNVRRLRPMFESTRVFVAPLRFGAGMKGKVGESMSQGVPVVTTSIGAEGMMLTPGKTALVADDPGAFADAVVRLYRDERLWRRISEHALRHVEKHFSQAVALSRLAALLPPAPATARAPRGALRILARSGP